MYLYTHTFTEIKCKLTSRHLFSEIDKLDMCIKDFSIKLDVSAD